MVDDLLDHVDSVSVDGTTVSVTHAHDLLQATSLVNDLIRPCLVP